MDAIGPEVDVMLGGEIALAPARNNARAPLRSTAVSGSVKVPGWESWKTLVSVTAYHSFGGEVELRTPHDTPPHLLMPSPTFAHSSGGPRQRACCDCLQDAFKSRRKGQLFAVLLP